MSISVLIVDPAAENRKTLASLFESRGDTVRTAGSSSEARLALAEHCPDVAVVVLYDGVRDDDLAAALRGDDPELGMVLLTEPDAVKNPPAEGWYYSVMLDRAAPAEDVLAAAEHVSALGRSRAELELRRQEDRREQSDVVVPASVDMLVDLAARNAEVPVLIVGEPGTGKGQAARLIHERSLRAGKPFFQLRCTTIAQASLERRLFGSERGAGSHPERSRGLLELADGGSVLLSAVSRLPFETQASLLRFIEHGNFRRTHSSVELRSDVRVLAAAARPLAPAVDSGLFRADLFYRLQVLTISLPPLRERRTEIERLVYSMLAPGTAIAAGALLALQEHSWPGNLRELSNALWRATIMSGGGTIEVQHLPLTAALDVPLPRNGRRQTPGMGSLSLAELEKRTILAALERTGGNKLRAAALLGIARSTLHEKLKRI